MTEAATLLQQPREEIREIAVYRQALSLLPESFSGPRPWCRICQRQVLKWAWTRYADGFWGVSVFCHDEWCGGLLPQHMDRFYYLIEAFCYDEPHIPVFPLWWVTYTGHEIQASQDYLDDAVRSGHEMPILGGWFGKFARSIWSAG